MLCKDCSMKNDFPHCSPDDLGTCEVCGGAVLSPCDTHHIGENGQIVHNGCE